MRGWRKGIDKARARKELPVDAKEQEKEFDIIAKWVAYQGTPRDQRKDDKLINEGQALYFKETNKCFDCHKVEKREMDGTGKISWVKDGGELGPDLSNYGSGEWIRAMIMSPGHKARYGDNNLMPAFRNTDGAGAELSLKEFRETNPPPAGVKEIPIQHLSDVDREMIIRWILRDYRPVFGGTTIAK
jgi:hypothetical protein